MTDLQNNIPAAEGVIKYHLDYQQAKLDLPDDFIVLNVLRSLLWRLGLIGQDPERYGGLGYGNLSMRLSEDGCNEALAIPRERGGFQEALAIPRERGGFQEALAIPRGRGGFLVTGTQTGHLPHLTAQHYVRVVQARPKDNYLQAEGPIAPSSEALTHAAVYAASDQVQCVAHVHSPEIWQQAEALALLCVPAHIVYGTRVMAEQVGTLVSQNPTRGVIAMQGHKDGLVAYGEDAALVGKLLVYCLAESYLKTAS